MRSIRLSLLVYFLALLVVALGVASLLVYRSAQRTLEDKEEATSKLVQAKYEERCREERKRLDDGLLEEALSLAGRLQIQWNWGRLAHRSLHSLGAVTAAFTPSGYLSMAPW